MHMRPLPVVVYFRRLLRIEAAPSASPDMDKYDIIVIGSGPAGQRAAIQAAKFGKRAALVEKMEVIGGAALNTGTIPSKTMPEAVLHLSGFYYQSIFSGNYPVKEKITTADLNFRAQNGLQNRKYV